MSRRTPAATGGIVVSLLGLAAVAVGAIVMSQHAKGPGLALVGVGFALVVLGSWVSTLGKHTIGGKRPPQDA
jgi:hypothetical protein